MNIIDFLGINVIILVGVGLTLFVYLIFLINKRRKEKFLHTGKQKQE